MAAETKKTVLITGAAGGIGRVLCAKFASAGYAVIGSDRLPDYRAGHAYVSADLSQLSRDPSYRSNFVERVRAAANHAPLHCLVNNAAVQALGEFVTMSDADWSETLSVNLLAPACLMRAFRDDLEQASGSVVNIASIHANLTKRGFSLYATSKAALVGLTRSLAIEWGAAIRVNAICPAAIETDMLLAGFSGNPTAFEALRAAHPVGRIGTPADVAAAALYLASAEAAFVNGCILSVDGGVGSRLFDPG